MTREVYGEEDELEESEEVGIAIPATMGILGVAFIGCALVISGLPPLSGFIAKFALLTAALNPPAGAVPVSRLDFASRSDPVWTGGPHRHDARRHPCVLGCAGPDGAARAADRDGACCRASAALRDPDDPGGAGHALHAGHGAVAAHSSRLYPRRSWFSSVSGRVSRGDRHDAAAPLSDSERQPACSLAAAQSVAFAGAYPFGRRRRSCRGLGACRRWSRREHAHGGSAHLFRLAVLVVADIVRSNVAVARIILGFERRRRSSGFVEIPLELRDPYGLAALACIITSTPGTLWVDFNEASGTLTIHVLDLVDKTEWVRTIKGRYERLLLEIFA